MRVGASLHKRLFIVATFACAWFCCGSAWAEPRPGDHAPVIIGETVDGQPFDSSAVAGQVLVINFWASWCGPCRVEMPALDAVARAHRGQGLVLVGISLDNPHDRDAVVRAMQGLSYQTLLSRQSRMGGLQAPLTLPQTVVIDRSGIVRAVFEGGAPLTAETLEAAVAPLLRDSGEAPSFIQIQRGLESGRH